MITVGFDPGNSEATLIAMRDGRQRTATVPSYIGTGTLAELERLRGGAGGGAGGSAGNAGELALEVDGGDFFVGALALEQTGDASSARGDIARYWSGHTRRLLLALAGMTVTHNATIRVVTGLPVEVWAKTTVQQVQRSLIGTHQYTLNGKPRTLTVEGVLVVMEGAGALAAYGRTADVPQAVIDIGGRTTDLFWSQGMQPVRQRCRGAAVGVEKAADLLGERFRQQHRRELSLRETRAVLRAAATGTAPPALFVNGQPVQLNGQVDAAISTVGESIVSFVAQTWRTSEDGGVASDAATVLLIGGGAYYFADRLRQVIPHLTVPTKPELANAQGYLAMAAQVPDAAWAGLRG